MLALVTTCTGCGTSGQPEGARFCFSCGADLQDAACALVCRRDRARRPLLLQLRSGAGDAAAPAPAGGLEPVASRRITSVLFGDLVGFTSLSETRDQEEVRELLSRYFEECRQIIARYGGTVEKFIGDAVMAVWGVPDHARGRRRAGRPRRARAGQHRSPRWAPTWPSRTSAMRVGIVTGEVAVTIGAEHQGMVAGDAVNTASRVQSAAAPGQVWVDETTRLLTTSAITYVDVGSHAMKGKADPVPLWSVRAVVAAVGGAQRADGLEAPHVGRDRELRLVKELFHGVEETRRPALLLVDGEPGVGKSRLGWEFEKYTDGLQNRHPLAQRALPVVRRGRGVLRARRGDPRPAADAARRPTRTRATRDEDQAGCLRGASRPMCRTPTNAPGSAPRLEALLGVGAVGSFKREDLFVAWTTFLHRVSDDESRSCW